MVKIELNLLNIFALQTKSNKMTFEGKTVGNIVEKFVKKYKDKLDEHLLDKKKERLSSQMLILLNGKNVRTLKNYKTKLQEGDKLYFSYPISGG